MTKGSPIVPPSVEKIAMRLDMRGEPQRVLAREALRKIRVTALGAWMMRR